MGRYKLGPQGTYYDPNDTGPDQASAAQIAAFQGGQSGQSGSLAPFGGTPTVPPTAQAMSPQRIWNHRYPSKPPLGGPPGVDWNKQPIPDLFPQVPQAPAIDLSRYDPNLSYTDYERDYWADDRDAVLVGFPHFSGLPVWGGASPSTPPVGEGGINPPSFPSAAPASPTSPQRPTRALRGAVESKLNDPSHNTPKYVALRLLGQGASMEQIAQALGPRFTLSGDDTLIDNETGDIIDLLFGHDAGIDEGQWTIVGNINDQGSRGGASEGSTPIAQSLRGALTPTAASTSAAPVRRSLPSLQSILPGEITSRDQQPTTPIGSQTSPSAPTASSGDGGAGSTYDVEVGSDPLSQSLNEALMQLIGSGGSTTFGNQLKPLLMSIITGGGMTPDLSQQLIGARTNAARAQQALLADADAALADRGLASVPGMPSGAAIGATERIASSVGADFADALRDIETRAMELGQGNVQQALALATGMSQDDAGNILNAIGTGTNRQSALANIALQTLQTNQDWNKFLLNYGLDQQKLAEDIANGRMDRVIALLKLFLEGADISAGGYY